MKKSLHILFGIGAAATFLFVLDDLKEYSGGIGILNIFESIVIFFTVYLSFKPSKRKQREKDAVITEEFHRNGRPKVWGKTIYGKKEEEWKYYNENGKLIREDIYNDGHLMRSIDHIA